MIDENIVIINTDSSEIPSEGSNIYESRKNITNLHSNNNVLVSILVVAYNRLDKTMNCIESILKYTQDVDYELILVDSGSDNETLEYFHTVQARKKIIRITKNLQLPFAIIQGTKYCSGKYISLINNDMIVTTNWLSNILKCFASDDKIGMVCTDSLNVSNWQNAGISFDTFEEMQEKAKLYNVSDPRKWHERLRLITLGTVYKKECIEICGNWDYGFFHDFSDDDLTFHIRRGGYKTILCKDVFVHHDHEFNYTDTEKLLKYKKSLEKGRENFKNKYYGIDAWDDTNNFEYNMISILETSTCTNPNVLGIDVKCGTPILEIKNKLKSYSIFDTCLSAFTEEAKYFIDLKTICEGDVECDRIEYISEHFTAGSFDYILLGKAINLYSEPFKLLTDIFSLINDNGQILLKLRNINDIRTIYSILGNKFLFDEEYAVYWTIDDFLNWVYKLGYRVNKIVSEQHFLDEDSLKIIKQFFEKNSLNMSDMNKMLTENYILSISKI